MFTAQAGEKRIEARYEDETVWLSQKMTRATRVLREVDRYPKRNVGQASSLFAHAKN